MPDFAHRLIQWYDRYKRPLPWRETRDPYRLWVSEVILQQTRVTQGLPYYLKFISSFPDISSLARATEDQVMKMWQGLGYYSRARNMMKAARMVMEEFDGRFPSDYHQLLQLPGIGKYTAAAVSSFSAGQEHPVIDGNVTRFLARLEGITSDITRAEAKRKIEEDSYRRISQKDPGKYNQAIMEFGAQVCRPGNPLCMKCPFREACRAYKMGIVDEIPFKPKKKELEERHIHYLVVFSRIKGVTEVLLNKRKDDDIWRDLYDFPSVEADRSLEGKELEAMMPCHSVLNGSECTYIGSSDTVNHLLSHRKLIVRFFFFEAARLVPGKFITVRWNDVASYPVPKVVENYLREAELPWSKPGGEKS